MYRILNKNNHCMSRKMEYGKGYSYFFTNAIGYGCQFESYEDAYSLIMQIDPLNWLNYKIIKRTDIKDIEQMLIGGDNDVQTSNM